MRPSRILVLVVGVLIAALLWTTRNKFPNGGRRAVLETPGPAQEAHAPELRSDSRVIEEAAPAAQAQAHSATRREEVSSPVVTGWVVDSAGDPVAGCLVEMTVLTRRDLEWEPAWKEGEWGPTDSPSQRTWTGSDGRFSFERWLGEEETGRFVLSASDVERGRASGTFSYPPGEEGAIRLVLPDSDPLVVAVVRSDGSPAPGAMVEQFGIAPRVGESAPQAIGPEDISARHVHATAVADEVGIATIPRFDGEQALVATLENAVSLPWRGRPQGRITLRLLDSFELSGTVILPDWSDLHYEGERRMRIALLQGSMERNLTILRHIEAGDWGPIRLPRVEGAVYRVYLEGSPIIPVQEDFAAPATGAHIYLELRAERGRNIWITAVNREGEIIHGSEATLRWEEDGTEHSVTRGARPDGNINIWSFPDEVSSAIDVHIEAPGYISNDYPDQDFSIGVNEEGLTIPLDRAGRITGTVSSHGEPVSDFRVLAISEGHPWVYAAEDFWGREDGSFELDGVAPGAALVIASSPEHPPGNPTSVTVREGEDSPVELELADGGKRGGVVLAADTGRPIVGARIRQRVSTALGPAAFWGPAVVTDETGAFEIDGMKRGVTLLRVSADDYSDDLVRVTDSLRDDAPPIRIDLSPLQSFDVTLHGPGNYASFHAYSQVTGMELPLTPFDAGGRAHFEGVAAGRHVLKIAGGWDDEDEESILVVFELTPGKRRNLDVAIGGANHLLVHFEPKDPAVLPADKRVGVEVRYRSSKGLEAYRFGMLDEDGRFEADCFDAPIVWVRLVSMEGTILAAAQGVFRDGELVLDLDDSEEPFRLRVVDPEKHPVAGVEVRALDPVSTILGPHYRTDAEGFAELYGLPSHPVRIELFHDSRGMRLGVDLDPSRPDPTLTLAANAAIQLVASSPAGPVPSAEAVFLDGKTRYTPSRRRADSTGTLTWSLLSPGTYRVRVSAPSHWPETLEVRASPNPTPLPVPLRRLGDLTLHFVDDSGLPLSGVPIDLIDTMTGKSVATWAANGLVDASPKTDNGGTATYHRLPEGDYIARNPQGLELAHPHVTGAETTEITIRVP
ncbi:MAG TPA: hypothetical protein ENJ09_02525 [Planctomycetes bacterium]|nr:hypothetical protein [Planctomycetota bacterium]